MLKFTEIFQDLVVKRLNQVYQFIIQFGPKIALAIIILLIGWLSALLLKKIIAKLLKALGFDVVSEKTGLRHCLERGGITRTPSSVIGLGFYWLIIFSTLIMAFNTLELEAGSQLIRQVLFYLPKIIIAVIFLTLGIFLGRFVGKFVEKTLLLANIPMSGVLGRIAGYIIIGLGIMTILEYLNVARTLVVEYAVIVFGVVPLVLCLIFLIGGRGIISSLLAARVLMKEFKKGDRINFDSVSGDIDSIGPISTKLRSGTEEVIIPNAELAKKIIRKTII